MIHLTKNWLEETFHQCTSSARIWRLYLRCMFRGFPCCLCRKGFPKDADWLKFSSRWSDVMGSQWLGVGRRCVGWLKFWGGGELGDTVCLASLTWLLALLLTSVYSPLEAPSLHRSRSPPLLRSHGSPARDNHQLPSAKRLGTFTSAYYSPSDRCFTLPLPICQ